jgi:signal transduction histidine kinase
MEANGELVAVLGHELRNPIAAALAGVAVACELTDAADPRRPFLERASRDLGRASSLLASCLALGRGLAVAGATADLGDVLRAVAVRARGVAVTVATGAQAAPVRADRGLVERVFENLVENAAQAGALRVELTLACGPGELAVTVQDDGPGIDAGDAERVFAPFWSGGGGSGVGLWLVRRVLAAAGGGIRLEPGAGGARFVVTLPRAS